MIDIYKANRWMATFFLTWAVLHLIVAAAAGAILTGPDRLVWTSVAAALAAMYATASVAMWRLSRRPAVSR